MSAKVLDYHIGSTQIKLPDIILPGNTQHKSKVSFFPSLYA